MAAFSDFACSIARAVDLAGEWWTPLILRDLFAGMSRFDAIQRDLGPMPKTALEDDIRETAAIFRRLRDESRLDTVDLDAPKPPPVTVADEP